LTKYPDSSLKDSVPRTWDLEISFADELDEMWSDQLWDLGNEIDTSSQWWILKPGMADRGMGIRLFNSKDSLYQIFEEFEEDSEDEDHSTIDTSVVISQLRHFVVQVTRTFFSRCNAERYSTAGVHTLSITPGPKRKVSFWLCVKAT